MRRIAFYICLALLTASSLTVAQDRLAQLAQRAQELEKSLEELRSGYFALFREFEQKEGRVVDIATVCEGRLTTESGTPLSTTDRSNQSTLYFTPYMGNNVSIWDGTKWVMYAFTEKSLALSGLSAGTNYDIFVYYNGSAIAIDTPVAWSSNIARATALDTVGGVLLKNGDNTRRYVGTIRATSATQTQDTAAQRFVWNYQNRLRKKLKDIDTTNTWSYLTNAWRSANNTNNNRVEFVVGSTDVLVEMRAMSQITNATGTLNYYSNGVGLDTTTNVSSQIRGSGSDNNIINQVWSDYKGYPPLGYHYLQWVERSAGTAITVWGDNGDNTSYQGGIIGEFSG